MYFKKNVVQKLMVLFLLVFNVGCKYKTTYGLNGLGLTRKDSNNQGQVDQLDGRITRLEQQVLLLQTVQSGQQTVLDLLGQQYSSLQNVDSLILDQINTIMGRLDDLESDLYDLDCDLSVVQAQIVNLFSQISALQTASQHSIVALIDPCGDGAGFDEILLKLQNGTLIAYFESGSNRHLSVLPAGSYRTTDAQNCNFTVSSSGVVSW